MSGKVSGNVWGELEFSAMIDSGWLAGWKTCSQKRRPLADAFCPYKPECNGRSMILSKSIHFHILPKWP